MEDKFSRIIKNMDKVYKSLPYQFKKYALSYIDPETNRFIDLTPDERINVRKIALKMFDENGYKHIKNEGKKIGTVFQKEVANGILEAIVIPNHRGHYLQTIIRFHYENKTDGFNDFSYDLKDEQEVKHYLIDIIEILKYLENELCK